MSLVAVCRQSIFTYVDWHVQAGVIPRWFIGSGANKTTYNDASAKMISWPMWVNMQRNEVVYIREHTISYKVKWAIELIIMRCRWLGQVDIVVNARAREWQGIWCRPPTATSYERLKESEHNSHHENITKRTHAGMSSSGFFGSQSIQLVGNWQGTGTSPSPDESYDIRLYCSWQSDGGMNCSSCCMDCPRVTVDDLAMVQEGLLDVSGILCWCLEKWDGELVREVLDMMTESVNGITCFEMAWSRDSETLCSTYWSNLTRLPPRMHNGQSQKTIGQHLWSCLYTK
jgi:hypothetical protein